MVGVVDTLDGGGGGGDNSGVDDIEGTGESDVTEAGTTAPLTAVMSRPESGEVSITAEACTSWESRGPFTGMGKVPTKGRRQDMYRIKTKIGIGEVYMVTDSGPICLFNVLVADRKTENARE